MLAINQERCRLCGSAGLRELLDLGKVSLARFPASREEMVPEEPLVLCTCPRCGLAQLGHTVPSQELYSEYWYRSSMNRTMRWHLYNLARDAAARAGIGEDDVVLDIGCNDGFFLSQIPTGRKVGFDPSDIPSPDCTRIKDYFSATAYQGLGLPRARLVTSIAMFYDLNDPRRFVQDVAEVLAADGVWIVEFNYYGDLLEDAAIDFITHEHVTYFTATIFVRLVEECGLRILDTSLNRMNGGSIRFTVGHASVWRPQKGLRLEPLLGWERQHLDKLQRSFKARVAAKLLAVQHLCQQHERIYAYGASTRGLTLLSAFGLQGRIEKAVEHNPAKVGRYYGATGIPIISEEAMRAEHPDALLILPYSYIEEFRQRESTYLASGGKLLVPMPQPRSIALQR